VTGHFRPRPKKEKKEINEDTPKEVFLEAQKRIQKNMNEFFDEETNQTHWLWSKSIDKRGYGMSSLQGRTMGAHVVSWIAFNQKPVPSGHYVLHKCKKRPDCVNPAHLYTGTHTENMMDKKRDGTGNPVRKITEETAQAIMLSKGQGTMLERAKKFNVSVAIINGIDRGTSWKDLRKKLNLPVSKRGQIIQEEIIDPIIEDTINSEEVLNKYTVKLKSNIILSEDDEITQEDSINLPIEDINTSKRAKLIPKINLKSNST
jgi:hypothetical protein